MNIYSRTIVEFKIEDEEIQIICSSKCSPEIMNQALLLLNQHCNELIAKKMELEKKNVPPTEEVPNE